MDDTPTNRNSRGALILQGAGLVALVGLGKMPFGLAPAFAAANDKYPEEAFKQKSEADAIKSLYGKTAEESDKIKLDAPEIAENGSVVPVSVTTTLADVTSISFLVARTRSRWWRRTRFRRAPCRPSPTASRWRRPAT